MQNFNLPSRSLPTGDTVFGPFAIPVGTSKIAMTLDVAQMVSGVLDGSGNLVSGQRVWIRILWQTPLGETGESKADFLGPWRDRQGVMHNDVALNFDFGSFSVNNGPWQQRLSEAGWTATVTFTVENGPYITAGGTLALT